MKKYILTIAYNESTEEIEYLQEEIVTDDDTFYYGDIDMGEYWDDETINWLKGIYIIGEA
jgi:hypothetical protein